MSESSRSSARRRPRRGPSQGSGRHGQGRGRGTRRPTNSRRKAAIPGGQAGRSPEQIKQPAQSEALFLAEPVNAPQGWRQIGSGKRLLVFLVIVFLVASLAGLAPPGPWYEALNKPDWTPPNWLFGPAWTVLYLMIAVAGWIIFSNAPTATTKVLWSVQLVLNAAWSQLFFGAQQIGFALIDVTAMSVLALVLIVVLLRQVFAWSRLAALLFVPYWLWVSFAGALNASIWMRNPVI